MATKKNDNQEEDLGLKLAANTGATEGDAKSKEDVAKDAEIKKLQAQVKAEKAKNQNFDDVKSDYWRVVFHPKSNESQENQVQLGVNGEFLVMQRNVEVILHNKFLEVADHAIVKQYKQLPGEPRRCTGQIQTFPYRKVAPATKAEHAKFRKEMADKKAGKL